MARVYDEKMTAAQVAVAKEYRKTRGEFERARDRFEEERLRWEVDEAALLPQINQLEDGLRAMGLDPEDFQ